MSESPLNVGFLPVYQNPYQHLLTAALREQNIVVGHLSGMPPFKWLWRERHRVDVLHLHWLSGLYMRRYWTPVRLAAFLCRFLIAQRLGFRIVWTAHNLLPHRQPCPPLHRMIRRFVVQRADAIIVHCEYASQQLQRLYPSSTPLYVIPHGNYCAVLPATLTRAEARRSLDIALDQSVFLVLGNISPYKGIGAFIDTFLEQAGRDDLVVVAGRNRDSGLVARLETLAARDARVRIHPGYIPDEQLANFLLSADVMVAPFREVLTSGSVVLGMSAGLPIIAPALGCLPELVTPECGILYNPDEAGALGSALKAIATMDTEAMGRAAKGVADTLGWDSIAGMTAAVYRESLA